MPFGRKSEVPVRVFKYGCLRPTQGAEQAMAQTELKARYWNAMVDVQHAYLDAYAAVENTVPSIAEDRAIIESILEETPVNWKAFRETAERVCDARYAARRTPGVKEQLEAVHAQYVADLKRVAPDPALYWSNAEAVKFSWQNGPGKLCGWNGLDRPRRARYRTADPERAPRGRVSARTTTGTPVVLVHKDANFQIDRVPEEAFTAESRGVRRRLSRTVCRIRVGSTRPRGREQVWLELPMVYDRPLPPHGMIKTASVVWERVGYQIKWYVVISVAYPEAKRLTPSGNQHGKLAVDIGWRQVPSGLRIAVWQDYKGESGELVLSHSWLQAMEKVENLRSVRDQHFDAARAALAAWVELAPGVPSWFREETESIRLWKSPRRLVKLAESWNDRRFHADDMAFALLWEWRKRERHLMAWEANLRRKLQGNREDLYRTFAAWAARTYAEVRFECFNLSDVAEVKRDGTDLPITARRQRFIGAPSLLRGAVANACGREGVQYVEVKAAYTTQDCMYCGDRQKFNQAEELVHVCTVCGQAWDQDVCAAANIIRSEDVVKVA